MASEFDTASAPASPARRMSAATVVALCAGLGAGVAAGGALWATQGGNVFLAQAFAALAACF